MDKNSVKKIMVYDQGTGDAPHPSFLQNMTKMQQLFEDRNVDFVRFCFPEENHEIALKAAVKAVREEAPDILLIGATALGEELAPSLGVRLASGVAAHCADIKVNDEGRIAYMVPAFGGKVIGEIFIPDSYPAIATVKPGVFTGDERSAGSYRTIEGEAFAENDCTDSLLNIISEEKTESRRSSVEKAKLVICGGFGIGSRESWEKVESLAERTGGGAGCTRPVVDMGWGPDEYSMIGTSGRTIRPKVYIGFGISGAAHHLCGIKDADIIININNDENAAVFAASDYKAVLDANKVMDALLNKF